MAEQALSQRFKELCNDLNLDKSTTDDAWKTFQKIRLEYILEGDKIHWLTCAIYVACRKSLPAVGTKGHSIEGNCVSLTRLLRSCKLSLVEFFNKMKKWLDMANQTHDIRSKVEHLERNFNVSAVIFKKYRPIMMDLLHQSIATYDANTNVNSATEISNSDSEPAAATTETPTATTPAGKGRGKSTSLATGGSKKPVQVGPSDVFDFCWTLFVNVKGNHPSISDDLVNSYHLLLACIELCYVNALQCENATELLNPHFSELPKNFGTDEFKLQSPSSQPPCILQALCNKWDGIVVEAKGIREHWWKPYIKKLVERKVLKCNDPTSVTGLFESTNFEHNVRQLTREYDHCVLNIGDFDERVFLSSNAHEELGTPAYDVNDLNKQMVQRMGENNGPQQQQHQQSKGRFVPQTPLSNRQYLDNRMVGLMTPVSNATQSVSRLHAMLLNRKDVPSQTLDNIFKLCPVNPSDDIIKRLDEMAEKFSEAHSGGEITKRRIDLGRRLYFKVLENIMLREQKKLPTDKIGENLSNLLAHETFHVSLFACCMEIVMASYNSRTFPWILEVFNDFRGSRLHPFQFYKVIEPLIRDEEGLSRDIVKHLNSIEERILESMAWESDSPLWPAIEANGCVPRSEEVPLPKSSTDHTPPGMSPLSYLKRREGFQSPISTSERYSSALESGARRRLFAQGDLSSTTSPQLQQVANQVTVSTNSTAVVSGSPQGQIVHIAVPTQTPSGIKYVQLQAIAMPVSQANNQSMDGLTSVVSAGDIASVTAKVDESESMPVRPIAKSNPVNLFFRKVYNLAHLRLRDFWSRLQIENQDLKRKIWTLFENQLRTHTDLMRDRHLDQMLMCAIYAVFKVCRLDRTSHFFQDILRAYRLQPQHSSAVYRSVLLQCATNNIQDVTKQEVAASDTAAGSSATTSNTGRSGVGVRSPSRRQTVSANSTPTKPVNGFQVPDSATPANGAAIEGVHRGDLIQFYNTCYVPQVERLVRRLRPDIPEASLMLSPLPQLPTSSVSPWRRVSQQHSVYVSPLRRSTVQVSPGRPLSYSFQRSPAKDLRTINDMINRDRRVVSKRILQDNDGENASSAKRLCAAFIS